jgi:integrase/recombinase XerD
LDERKLTLRDPKSGRGKEIVSLPQKLADLLKEYIRGKGMESEERIFPITHTAARVMVKKAGLLARVHLRPYDLWRHAATFASRSGVLIELVGKIILGHGNLSTTQGYLVGILITGFLSEVPCPLSPAEGNIGFPLPMIFPSCS